MAEGRIKWYSHQLGHGFILCDEPPGDVFMRSEDITDGDPWSLDAGEKVTFEVVDAPEGKEARVVCKVSQNAIVELPAPIRRDRGGTSPSVGFCQRRIRPALSRE